MTRSATALIAEDEALLATDLARMLASAWPELAIVAQASDGIAATAQALHHAPDILFLDIRMPGRSGLEVAEVILDEWPGPSHAPSTPLPLIVFVTAYDEFAIAAFEREAVDFLLKPVSRERLAKTIERIQGRLLQRGAQQDLEEQAHMLDGIQRLGTQVGDDEPVIDVLQIGVGNTVRMVPVEDVLLLEANDKYVNVITTEGEAVVRLSLRELLRRTPRDMLLQVHRSTAVNRRMIISATRDDLGHVYLNLRGLARKVQVSRAFVHLFRAM